MLGETFFYWFGVGSFVLFVITAIPFIVGIPTVLAALVGRGILEVVLWWDEYWLEYEEGENEHETIQNKTEAYEEAHEEGRWEARLSRFLSNNHKRCSNFTDWYLDVADKYFWQYIPVGN